MSLNLKAAPKALFLVSLLVLVSLLPACPSGGGEGLYARFEVSSGGKAAGSFLAQLDFEGAPLIVTDFVGLATAKLDAAKGKPYYDGTAFHRAIPQQFIQGGDPTGTGKGGPGFLVPDEFVPGASHAGPGVLSMVTSAPNYNGSQFLITLTNREGLYPTHFDNTYSIFGKVVEGMAIVDAAKQGDLLAKLTIEARGDKAKAFLDGINQAGFDAALAKKFEGITATGKKVLEGQLAMIKAKYPDLVLEPEGIWTKVQIPGEGPAVPKGAKVRVNYELSLATGQILDSTFTRGTGFDFTAGETEGDQGVIEGWDIAVRKMAKGERRIVVIPPELGYGSVGIPEAGLPPDSYLVFDVEVLDYTVTK